MSTPKPSTKPKPKISPKPKVTSPKIKQLSTPRQQFITRMEKAQERYVLEALEDWQCDYPDEDPDTSESWAEEKALVIEEFKATTWARAEKEHTKLMLAMETAMKANPSPRTKPKPTIKPKPATPPKPVVSPKPKPLVVTKNTVEASPPSPSPLVEKETEVEVEVEELISTDRANEPTRDQTSNDENATTITTNTTTASPTTPPTPPKPKGPPKTRGPYLTQQQWEEAFDPEGRMVNESDIKKIVFLGGVEPKARKEVWPFLVGMYEFGSTTREREIIEIERRIEYTALKERWKEELQSEDDGVVDMEIPSEDLDDMHQFMFIQAKVNAMRYPIDKVDANKNIKMIGKDVPRTDRKGGYFDDDKPHRLQWLNDILVAYAVFHPAIGYAQGMNDVLSMILAVMDHEADAYWCFKIYMDAIHEDFDSQGMMDKLASLVDVVKFMDPEFFRHLELIDGADMVFCHRWLLLGFKREFTFSEATKLFEILCSHHLELSSIQADKERTKESRSDKKKSSADSEWSATEDMVERMAGDDDKYTFELFVCLSVLKLNRDELMAAKDVSDIFAFMNKLVCTMDLNEVLLLAEEIFYGYCRKSVSSVRVDVG